MSILGGIQNLEGTERFQKRREKSTIILVMIVVIFLICNSYRLVVKLYLACNSQVIHLVFTYQSPYIPSTFIHIKRTIVKYYSFNPMGHQSLVTL